MDNRPIDVETLKDYLAETLPPEAMARVEKALRDSSELRAQLEDVRQNRGDAGLHSLGAIWKRSRLTCATRQELGSFLLEALDPDHADYLKFHIEVIACPFCQANLADLQHKAERAAPAAKTRQKRIYDSSRGLLSGEG
ncbi:MAG: hypothetical protein JWN86_2173 [Planctomycetota bacterium]|nr:hypothetical protein [Planctomycetota bacterium]